MVNKFVESFTIIVYLFPTSYSHLVSLYAYSSIFHYPSCLVYILCFMIYLTIDNSQGQCSLM